MRQPRIKIAAVEEDAAYHCTSRTVNGEWLFGDVEKEILRRQFWQVADYCGLQLLTYAIMSNHFHVVVRVPRHEPVPDAELLRRYRVLYPKPTPHQMARLEVIQGQLVQNGPEAMQWRQQQLRLMGDISQYMKLVKQRFSIWFNKTHRRFGTLWAERFKSGLIGPGALQTIVAYVDLNGVRGGLATDPKDYRFCGYSEAVAGNVAAQRGLQSVVGACDWAAAQSHYREVLFGTGGSPRAAAASIPKADVQRVMAEGGKLPLAAVLRCRLRYLTEGAILGTSAFVNTQFEAYCRKIGWRDRGTPRPMPPCTDWGDLMGLRGFRRRAVG